MHSFRYGEYETWGLTAETLVRLCVLAFPAHPFPYDTRHPDGLCMEGWFGRVLALPEFRAEAERVYKKYGGGRSKAKGKGKGKCKKDGGKEAAAASSEGDDTAEAARRRRRTWKGDGES